MTRRQWIETVMRQYPEMRLSSIKEMVREAESLQDEHLVDRITRIRRDEGEWALHR